MATNKERIEQVEKTVEEVQAAVGGLEISMATMQKTLAAILSKLPDKESSSNSDSNGESGKQHGRDGGISDTTSPRMDLPLFDGTNPIAWLAQAEQYFLVQRVPPEQKVQLALIAMSGRSMFWAQWVLRRSATIPWNQFTQELIERFGDSSAINAYEAMHVTCQTGSLEDYLALFEERIAQLPPLPPEQQLGMFLGGLNQSIRDRIPSLEMTDVFAAIRAARRIARSQSTSTTPSKSVFTTGTFARSVSSYHNPSATWSQPQQSGNRPQFSSSASSGPRGSRNSRLSPEQQKEYIAKGKCFKCGERYSPTHRCAAKSLMVILEAEENDMEKTGVDMEQQESEEDEGRGTRAELQQLQLFKLSSNGFDGAQTLELFSKVGERRLLTMVDSGASHCFVAEHVAQNLKLKVERTTTFSVVLGDGTTVRSRGVCKAVPFLISDQIFHITCYVFALRSVDVILGVSWLAQLGDVTTNWARLTMEFEVAGKKVCLRGDPSLTRKAYVRTELSSFEPEDEAWLGVMDGPDMMCAKHGGSRTTREQANVEQLLYPTNYSQLFPHLFRAVCWSVILCFVMALQWSKRSFSGWVWASRRVVGWMWQICGDNFPTSP